MCGRRSGTLAGTWHNMSDQADELEAMLAGMRPQFLDTAAERVSVISEEASGLAIAVDPVASLTRLVREAHTLKSGGAMFGFSSLGDAGGRVEQIGKALLAGGVPLPGIEPLHEAVAALQDILSAARNG